VPGQRKSRSIQSFKKINNWINRKFASLCINSLGRTIWVSKTASAGKDQCRPSAVHGGRGVHKVTPQPKSPRRHVREAHLWDGAAVFCLHHSTQDDKLLFGDAKCFTKLRPNIKFNCAPRSVVIVSGTPKREIQEKTKALAHTVADVADKEMASIHLDVRSMTVKMKFQPPLFCRGSTKSIWRWEKRHWGMGIGCGSKGAEWWILACW
jgi:hypothetical protein